MARIVLDSSAVLAHLNDEPGAGIAAPFFGDALICAVNLSEVMAKLFERGASLKLVQAALSRYGLQIAPFDEELAGLAALLRPQTRALGLSLGDRACLALAGRAGLPVLTADRAWKELNLSIEVRLLR